MLVSRFLRYQSSSESVLRPQSVELLAPSGTDESVGPASAALMHAALARQLQLQVVSLGLVCDGNRESDVRLDATHSSVMVCHVRRECELMGSCGSGNGSTTERSAPNALTIEGLATLYPWGEGFEEKIGSGARTAAPTAVRYYDLCASARPRA
jgi:hypothetical protein